MNHPHEAYPTDERPPHGRVSVGNTPLTPSLSNSAGSDNYITPPPNGFDYHPGGQYPSEQYAAEHYTGGQQYHGFDPYAAHFSHPSAFPGPPTPPNQYPNVYNAQFQQHDLIGAADVAVQPPQPNGLPVTMPRPSGDTEASTRQGSDSAEEDESTPAQIKRKAQNRAAQRAFRERKERHVKELQATLAALEAARQETVSENEQLKRDLLRVSTENEILKATSTLNAGGPPDEGPAATGHWEYDNPNDFYDTVLAEHNNKVPCHRIVTSGNGERLYASGATWDYIISHDLYKEGLVDIVDISNRLLGKAICDGQGPVFEESTIIEAIEQSAGAGSDRL